MTPVEFLAIRLLDTATPEQRMKYQEIGAYEVAKLLMKSGEILKKWSGRDVVQNLLQQEPGADPAEDPS